jgi:hypothetical protein
MLIWTRLARNSSIGDCGTFACVRSNHSAVSSVVLLGTENGVIVDGRVLSMPVPGRTFSALPRSIWDALNDRACGM